MEKLRVPMAVMARGVGAAAAGWGWLCFLAFCLGGFDIRKAAMLWGGFLSAFAKADGGAFTMVTVGMLSAWLLTTAFVVLLGPDLKTRRIAKGNEHE